jgi:hypothetical protein
MTQGLYGSVRDWKRGAYAILRDRSPNPCFDASPHNVIVPSGYPWIRAARQVNLDNPAPSLTSCLVGLNCDQQAGLCRLSVAYRSVRRFCGPAVLAERMLPFGEVEVRESIYQTNRAFFDAPDGGF